MTWSWKAAHQCSLCVCICFFFFNFFQLFCGIYFLLACFSLPTKRMIAFNSGQKKIANVPKYVFERKWTEKIQSDRTRRTSDGSKCLRACWPSGLSSLLSLGWRETLLRIFNMDLIFVGNDVVWPVLRACVWGHMGTVSSMAEVFLALSSPPPCVCVCVFFSSASLYPSLCERVAFGGHSLNATGTKLLIFVVT